MPMTTAVLDQATGERWGLFCGDSCEVVKGIPDASVGMCLYSPPFSSLYIYSDSIADMGNSADHAEFFRHYGYLLGELRRITKPGRLSVVHCKDLPLYKNRDGAMGLYDFPGDVVRAHLEAGWTFHSRVTIWKDPVTEMQRTKNHGLLYKELGKDSAGSRQGMADYLLVFRNWQGEFKDPVNAGDGRAERFDSYIGMDPPDPTWIAADLNIPSPSPDAKGRWPKRNPFQEGPEDFQSQKLLRAKREAYRQWSISVWQKYASPVWFDIDQMNCLNTRAARDSSDEKHICPLQLDVIERAVHLWTNPGDVVFSPFAGLGSELFGAVKHGRKGLGCELKPAYFRQACEYLADLERKMDEPTLFDARATA